jgi:metal-dependent amidase/aminoacylase/carboxypeptidase family protein
MAAGSLRRAGAEKGTSMATRTAIAAAVSLASLAFAAPAFAQGDLRAEIEADYKTSLAPLFDHFHRNPELSHREFKTSERLAKEIRALGFEVTEKVGGTGVVAVMKNGEGPTVMIRADMDGLPVKEDSGLANAFAVTQEDIDGVVKPVMHACGHDTHITSLVGTARALAARRSKWKGTLLLIGQPAEERISGARGMLNDGLYKRFPKPDYALAFHVAAGVAASMGVPEKLMPDVICSTTESTPPTVNDAASVDIVKTAFTEHFGADRVVDMPPEGMGAEDFAYFVTPESGVKGVYFVVGATPEKELAKAPSYHSPFFRIEPEPAIKTATEAMVVAAMRFFNGD